MFLPFSHGPTLQLNWIRLFWDRCFVWEYHLQAADLHILSRTKSIYKIHLFIVMVLNFESHLCLSWFFHEINYFNWYTPPSTGHTPLLNNIFNGDFSLSADDKFYNSIFTAEARPLYEYSLTYEVVWVAPTL